MEMRNLKFVYLTRVHCLIIWLPLIIIMAGPGEAGVGVNAPQAPTLDANLSRGHSNDCLYLDIRFYADLSDDMAATAAAAKEALYGLLDSDLEFAAKAEGDIDYALDSDNFDQLVYRLSEIQRSLANSGLSDSEKADFWRPIAECYQRVQAALSERIVPLDQRELLSVGDTKIFPVRVALGAAYPIMLVRLPRFQYAIARRSDTGSPYRSPLESLDFRDEYLHSLPATFVSSLPLEGVVNLPLKIVSAERGMNTLVEIDMEELEKMRGQQ